MTMPLISGFGFSSQMAGMGLLACSSSSQNSALLEESTSIYGDDWSQTIQQDTFERYVAHVTYYTLPAPRMALFQRTSIQRWGKAALACWLGLAAERTLGASGIILLGSFLSGALALLSVVDSSKQQVIVRKNFLRAEAVAWQLRQSLEKCLEVGASDGENYSVDYDTLKVQLKDLIRQLKRVVDTHPKVIQEWSWFGFCVGAPLMEFLSALRSGLPRLEEYLAMAEIIREYENFYAGLPSNVDGMTIPLLS